MPDSPIPFYDLMRNSNDPRFLRLRMVHFALEHGVKPCARAFSTTPKTVRKWRDRYEQGGYQALADQSRAPKNPPRRIPAAQRRRAIELNTKLPSWGLGPPDRSGQ